MDNISNFVDSVNGVVITTCLGSVTRGDVVTSCTALRSDPHFKPRFRQLVNLMQPCRLELDFKDLYGIHSVYDPFSNEGRRAVAAPSGGMTFELAHKYQAIVDNPHFEAFSSLIEANSWLGLQVTVLNAASGIFFARPHEDA